MLDYNRKGTLQDQTGFTWVFYGDNLKKNEFYILPRPNFIYDSSGNPALKLVTYNTDDPATKGSGFCHFEVELTVPPEIRSAIMSEIPKQFPDVGASVVINALDYDPGAVALLTLNDGTGPLEYPAPASVFGANTASFTVDLTAKMMDTVKKILTTPGGGFNIKYTMSVPASLPAVNATLSFDSSIAYQYQVTHVQHHTWGSDTPGSVQQYLIESQSSKVNIQWGIKNPSQQLVENVTDWANQTLQTLVTAKVNEALAIANMQSSDSFNISDVSSFTNTYSENQVISWWLYPQASLPSLADLCKDLAVFCSTVDTRQETITISAHLPFSQDSQNAPNVPIKNSKPVLLDKVTVTVDYPGLNQAEATYTFAQNSSHLFTAPFNTSHGDVFDLEYTATFKDEPGQVTGKVTGINQSEYSLVIESVGILTVTFDAHQAFMSSGQDNPLEEVTIDFYYMDGMGLGAPIHQGAIIKKGQDPLQADITSYTGYPINSLYNYTVTYVYNNGLPYTGPAVKNQNGFSQIIPQANAVHETGLILAGQKDTPILDVVVNVWYEHETSIPGVPNQPSPESPAVFTMIPKSPDDYVRDTFLGFINQNQPLIYSSTIDSLDGQIVINAQKIDNHQASIMISPAQRYFTVEISVTSIDWSKAGFSNVEVLIMPMVAGVKRTQQSRSWFGSDTSSNYVTVAYNEGQAVSYDWEIRYKTIGGSISTIKGTGATDIILDIPASPLPN